MGKLGPGAWLDIGDELLEFSVYQMMQNTERLHTSWCKTLNLN